MVGKSYNRIYCLSKTLFFGCVDIINQSVVALQDISNCKMTQIQILSDIFRSSFLIIQKNNHTCGWVLLLRLIEIEMLLLDTVT